MPTHEMRGSGTIPIVETVINESTPFPVAGPFLSPRSNLIVAPYDQGFKEGPQQVADWQGLPALVVPSAAAEKLKWGHTI